MEKQVHVTVQADKTIGQLDRVWRYIGYDECNYTYIPEGQKQISKFSALGDGPYYFRTHFLFCTGNLHHTYKWGSTNIYSENEQGQPHYDFSTFDRIIETYLSHQAKPFIELGFMPLDLVDRSHVTVDDLWDDYHQYRFKGAACPPKDYGKWHDLIYHTVRHCLDKYGEEEVKTWYWELWNEPDIFYWRGTVHEYCKLFDYTEKAVHEASESMRLGGPSTTGPTSGAYSETFLRLFLEHCKSGINHCTGKVGTRLDFVTFHVKGGGFPFKPHDSKKLPSVRSFLKQADLGLKVIEKCGYEGLEIVLSEADPDGWAAGGRFDNPNMQFRNTEYYATYVASSYCQLMHLAQTRSRVVRPLAWAFLFAGERCFEGTRAFSTQGIDKPVFQLWKMFSQLGDTQLELSSQGRRHYLSDDNDFSLGLPPDLSGIATRKGDSQYQILLYSHHDDWDLNGLSIVNLVINGLPPGRKANMKAFLLDDVASNPHAVWQQLDRPDYPNPKQIIKISEKENLEQVFSEESMVSAQGSLNVRVNLKTHSVALVLINLYE